MAIFCHVVLNKNFQKKNRSPVYKFGIINNFSTPIV
jgi:hypothetical protein